MTTVGTAEVTGAAEPGGRVRDPRDRVVLSGVSKSFAGTAADAPPAVADIDLTIEPGEFVCVVGPSGCGKTTLLKMLAGFTAPTTGSVTVGGVPVGEPTPDRGVVFQAPTLYPWLDVERNVGYGLRAQRVERRERRERVTAMLRTVGLEGSGRLRPYELSGGMQQRAQIARVLVTDPRIILMDEPFAALDQFTRESLQVELLRLWREKGKTVVFITHSVEEAVFLATRIVVLSARPGRVVIDRPVSLPGDGPDVVRDPEVKATPEFQELRTRLTHAIVEAHTQGYR